MANPEDTGHPASEYIEPPAGQREVKATPTSGDWRQAMTEATSLASDLAAGTMLKEVIETCKKEPDANACMDHQAQRFYDVTKRADLELDDAQQFWQSMASKPEDQIDLGFSVIDSGRDVYASHHAYAALLRLTGNDATADDQEQKAVRAPFPKKM